MPHKPPQNDDTLLTFPCEFVLKVFGKGDAEFKQTVLAIIRKHLPDLEESAISTRPSESGKYNSLSIKLYVTSKKQLDDIYRDLSASAHVLMAL